MLTRRVLAYSANPSDVDTRDTCVARIDFLLHAHSGEGTMLVCWIGHKCTTEAPMKDKFISNRFTFWTSRRPWRITSCLGNCNCISARGWRRVTCNIISLCCMQLSPFAGYRCTRIQKPLRLKLMSSWDAATWSAIRDGRPYLPSKLLDELSQTNAPKFQNQRKRWENASAIRAKATAKA